MLVSHLGFDHDIEEGCLFLIDELFHLVLPWLEHMAFQVVEIVENGERCRVLSGFEMLSDCAIEVVLRFVAEGRAKSESIREGKDRQDVLTLRGFITLEGDAGGQNENLEDVAHGADKLQVVSLDWLNEWVRSNFLNTDVDCSFELLPEPVFVRLSKWEVRNELSLQPSLDIWLPTKVFLGQIHHPTS